MNDNGWDKWKNHVLEEMVRLSFGMEKLVENNVREHQKLRKEISENQIQILKEVSNNHGEIQALKVKAGIWGLLGGSLSALTAILGFMLYKVFGG